MGIVLMSSSLVGEIAWIVIMSLILWWGYNYIKQFMPPGR